MAEIEQWVNLTRNDKWFGDGLTQRERMTRRALVDIQMAEERRATLRISKTADGGNAVYSNVERPKRAGFRSDDYSRRRVRTNRRGRVRLTIYVTLAGGDKYNLKVEHDGNEISSDDLVTRRKLYFQIIKMVGANAVSAADVTGMQSEFWNPADNIYVKLIEYSPGRTIPARRNYNDLDPTVDNVVRRLTRAQYDRSMRPYAFATLVCLRNGIPGTESQTLAGTFPVPPAAQTITLNTGAVLFDIVDPAEEWYGSLRWQPSSGGPPLGIPKASCTRSGQTGIVINTTGLPPGPGLLAYRMRVLQINGRGFSVPTNNYTLIAAQDAVTGATVPSATVMGVLIHEIGHKIGMVPGGRPTAADAGRPATDRHYLDRQGTYYWARGHNGGHCYSGAGLQANYNTGPALPVANCVMFGDTSSNTSNYCATCKPSIRKLDLRSRTNRGIRSQF